MDVEALEVCPVWGLPALDDDSVTCVLAAIEASSRTGDVAAMAMTCSTVHSGLQRHLREQKQLALEALTRRLGWSEEHLADAQILHSTGQGITDSDLVLLSCQLFAARGCIAPLLDHLNIGSNKIGDRGVAALIDAASRAPRKQLEVLMLSGNEIGDEGATSLARAIEHGAFPKLNVLAIGSNKNISAAGEAALRDACGSAGVSVRGVGVLRGAPLVKSPMKGSWVVQVEIDSAGATRTRSGVRDRAVERGDPLICP